MQIFPIIPHDNLPGFVAAEHIDWSNAGEEDLVAGGITGNSLTIAGIITADTINEYTGATGVTIEDVLLKDNNIITSGIGKFGTGGVGLFDGGRTQYLYLKVKDSILDEDMYLTFDVDDNFIMTLRGSPTLDGQDYQATGSPTFAGLTISTSGEINFRDTDISMGSTLADGILDMSADGSIRMFYDNADVGDTVNGQSFYVYRRAAEGDDYIRFYINNLKKPVLNSSATLQIQHAGSARIYIGSSVILCTVDIDLASGKVYKLDGTQVVGTRVIDARCDDALNSGDATTDGVIDALRDAMITHGLIAAA